jgi:hypothetical protein
MVHADFKDVKTMNLKGVAKQEDESSPPPTWQHQTAQGRQLQQWSSLFSLILPSPDLAPFDFHLFGPLKDALRGRPFADDDHELKHSVPEDFRRCSREFYATDTQRLKQRWKQCVDNEADFVGKWAELCKDAPIVYAHVVIILITVWEKDRRHYFRTSLMVATASH